MLEAYETRKVARELGVSARRAPRALPDRTHDPSPLPGQRQPEGQAQGAAVGAIGAEPQVRRIGGRGRRPGPVAARHARRRARVAHGRANSSMSPTPSSAICTRRFPESVRVERRLVSVRGPRLLERPARHQWHHSAELAAMSVEIASRYERRDREVASASGMTRNVRRARGSSVPPSTCSRAVGTTAPPSRTWRRHAGVSARTAFRYFPAKADLVFADAESDLAALRVPAGGPGSVASRSRGDPLSRWSSSRSASERRSTPSGARVIAANPTLVARGSRGARGAGPTRSPRSWRPAAGCRTPDERDRLGGLPRDRDPGFRLPRVVLSGGRLARAVCARPSNAPHPGRPRCCSRDEARIAARDAEVRRYSRGRSRSRSA